MIFCFFKQKTAYEMRISDWSSDVCSSDLLRGLLRQAFQSSFDLRCKLGHLGIFGRTDNLAAGHRTRIINGNIIEQPPNGLNLGFARAGRLERDQGQEQNSQSAEIGRASCRERVCPYV